MQIEHLASKYDFTILKELLLDCGHSFIREIFKIFENYSKEMVRIENSTGESNLEPYKQLAHKLKSTSAQFGATSLTEVCNDLEYFEGPSQIFFLKYEALKDQFKDACKKIDSFLTESTLTQ